MLGANHITNTTEAAKIMTIFSKMALKAFRAKLVLGGHVNTQYRADAVRGGVVSVPNVSNFVAEDKISNSQVVLQANTDPNITIQINKHKHTAFLVEDFTALQVSLDLMTVYTDQAGYAVRRAVDTDLANLATGFSQNVGAYNTALTDASLLSADELLNNADVPSDERFLFIKPKTLTDIRGLSDYVRYDGTGYAGGKANGSVGDNSIKLNDSGLVGRAYGADIYMSTQVAKAGNNTSNMLIHKDALALAVQRDFRSQSEYKLEYLGYLFVMDVVYGVAELRDNAGIEVRT